jgi:hypothetical protein
VQHIAEIIPHAVNGMRAASANNAASLRLSSARSLPELAEVLEAIESYDNPDVVLDTTSLRMNPSGLLDIPRLGSFAPTDWSLSQLARMAGVRLDRWFENTDGTTRADELNRRFARASGSVRLRTRRGDRPDGAPSGADGVLRALVSPTYAPISDARAARHLLAALTPVDDELRVIRVDLTSRTTTFAVKVGDAFTARDRETAAVGDVWGGVLFRNSGTGFASLIVALQLHRLLCKNGMVAPVPDALAMKRRHRGIDDEALGALMKSGLANIGDRLHRGHARLLASRNQDVRKVDDEIRDILDHAELPQRLAKPILDAYAREPSPTAFGVAQAMTLAAQDMSSEDRVELERVAGEFLTTFADA